MINYCLETHFICVTSFAPHFKKKTIFCRRTKATRLTVMAVNHASDLQHNHGNQSLYYKYAAVSISLRVEGLINPYSSPRGRLGIVPSPPRIQIDAQ